MRSRSGTRSWPRPVASAARARRSAASMLAGVREALVRVLGERLLDDLDERRRRAGRDLGERRRLLLHHLEQHAVHRLGVERLAAGQQLVEHAAEREHVGARVGLLAAHLLGGHVVRRPHHRAGAGHVGAAQAGQPEVHDLDHAARQQVDVRRLEVAVDDVLRVGEGEALGDLLDHGELLVEGHLALGDGVLQVDPVEQLHRHEDLVALESRARTP